MSNLQKMILKVFWIFFHQIFTQNDKKKYSEIKYVTYEKSDIYYDDAPIDKKGFHIIKNTEDK